MKKGVKKGHNPSDTWAIPHSFSSKTTQNDTIFEMYTRWIGGTESVKKGDNPSKPWAIPHAL